jgi:hypothetical protein
VRVNVGAATRRLRTRFYTFPERLNHLALHVDTREHVDALAAEALQHGWRPMFADRYPFAGGERHYAAYLENADGFEIELVAGRQHANGNVVTQEE